jgi:alkylated DNA repair dioxygenase AlkB
MEERVWLDERSWVDVVPGFVPDAAAVYDALVERAAWSQGRLWRYERWVEEPRLSTWVVPGRHELPHESLLEVHRAVRGRCGKPFDGIAMALYRDGSDCMAFHRDRDLKWLDDTVIALAVLGHRRPFHIRPRANRYAHHDPNKGATHAFHPGEGDLLVMGGACQVGWEHGVPQVPGLRAVRLSLQWRWTSRTGRQEVGGSYRAPRTFSRS